MSAPTFDSTLLSAKLEISHTIARIAHLTDLNQVDEYLELCTEDFTWEFPGRRARLSGRDEVRADRVALAQRKVSSGVLDSFHCITTLWVEVHGGGSATAHSHLVYMTSCRTRPVPSLVVRYEDRFVSTDDGWKLAHRILHDQ